MTSQYYLFAEFSIQDNQILQEIIIEKKTQLAKGRSTGNVAAMANDFGLGRSPPSEWEAGQATATSRDRWSTARNSRCRRSQSDSYRRSNDFHKFYQGGGEGGTELPQRVAKVQRNHSTGDVLKNKRYINMEPLKPLKAASQDSILEFQEKLASLCPDDPDSSSEGMSDILCHVINLIHCFCCAESNVYFEIT